MKIVVITAFPELIEGFLGWGIVARAIERGLAEVRVINLRDYAGNNFGHIDDRPYGGGPGMVLKYQPLRDAIVAAKEILPEARVCYLSPQGELLSQKRASELRQREGGLILICGRYEGIDQRVIEKWVDEQLSIGRYVLSGGEVAAAVVIECCLRLIPGAVGDEQSIVQESCSDWAAHDHPHYTRPSSIDGMDVPEVLVQGDHAAIEKWRSKQRQELESKARGEGSNPDAASE